MITEILQKAGKYCAEVRPIQAEARRAYPAVSEAIYWHPESGALRASVWHPETTKEAIASWSGSFGDRPMELWWPAEGDSLPEEEGFVKIAADPVARSIAVHLGLLPGKLFGAIPSNPGVLKSMGIGSLLGAGSLYGVGSLVDLARGNYDDPYRSRRKQLAALGGMLGAMPGAAIGAGNVLTGQPFLDNRWMTDGVKTAEYLERYVELLADGLRQPVEDWSLMTEKRAYFGSSGALASAAPVQTDAFGQVIWGDPRVSNRLSDAQKSTLGTVVYGAANLPYLARGVDPASVGWFPQVAKPVNMAKVLTGYGMGRLTAGIGAGIVSSLFNLEPETQERLKTVGGFAGALGQVADMALHP